MKLKNSPKTKIKLTSTHKIVLSVLAILVTLGGIYYYNAFYKPEKAHAQSNGKSVAFLDGYNYRKLITINNDQICGKSNLKNFVILVSETDPDLRHTSFGGNVTNLNGYDIAFTDKSSSKIIDYEIEEYNPQTGKVVIWVHYSSLKPKSDNNFYLYYGNHGISSAPDNSPWSNDNNGVWHLGKELKNANDPSSLGINYNTTVSSDGKIGNARYFNGTDAFIDFGNSETYQINDEITVSAWAKKEGANGHIINMGGGWDDPGYSMLWLGNNMRVELQRTSPGEKTISDNSIPNDNQWHYIVFTWDKKSKSITTYIDGVASDNIGTFSGPIGSPAENLNIGRKEQDAYYFQGYIDEGRVLSTSLSSNWICTEYNNQNDPQSFYSVGEVEENDCISSLSAGTVSASSETVNEGEFVLLSLTGQSSGISTQWQYSTDNSSFEDIEGGNLDKITSPSIASTTYFRVKADNGECIKYSNTITVGVHVRFIGLYGYRKKITINKSMVSGFDDLENFPVLISLTDEKLKSKENGGNVYRSNGNDIVFADKNGTFLSHEKESYDPATGELTAWVKLPFINYLDDQTFYIYYGNCDESTISNPSTYVTWSDDYKGIWHFNSNYKDATSNGNNGTNQGSVNVSNGRIGNGQSFNGSNQYINIGSNSSLQPTEAITLSSWIYHQGGNGHVINKGGGWTEDGYSLFYVDNLLRVELQNTASGQKVMLDNSVGTGKWQYLVATWDANSKTVTTYIDGRIAASKGSFNGPLGVSNVNLNIGRNAKEGYYFNGLIDEARVIAGTRSATWIGTEYNNQLNPSQYVGVSEEEKEIAWTGGNSIDWENPSNWCDCQIPNSGENVRIPSRVNKPKLDQDRIIGNLLVEENGSLNLNGKKLSVNGDIILVGSLVHNNGEIEFTGNSSQMVFSNGEIATSKLTINNGVGSGSSVTFNSDVFVENELSLINGIVTMASGTAMIIKDNAIANEGSAVSFVEGKIRKIGDDAFVFPTGKGGRWARIEMSAPTTATTFEAEYFNEPHLLRDNKVVSIETISAVEYWMLDKIAGDGKVRVSLYWENANTSGITNMETLRIIKRDALEDQWISFGQLAPPTGEVGEGKSGKIVGSELIERFSPFTFGHSSTTALPIELLSFSAEPVNGAVQLKWKTAVEINNDYFTIERSTDNVHFAPILTVKGAGNSNAPLSYTATDTKPFSGTSYYRLKQTDYDGKFEYFDVRAVELNSKVSLFEISNAYPNPFQSDFTIEFNSEIEGNGTIHVINYSGKVISSIPLFVQSGFNQYTYNGQNLASGTYLVYLTLGTNKTKPQKVIKK